MPKSSTNTDDKRENHGMRRSRISAVVSAAIVAPIRAPVAVKKLDSSATTKKTTTGPNSILIAMRKRMITFISRLYSSMKYL